jgi:hypothetical protein
MPPNPLKTTKDTAVSFLVNMTLTCTKGYSLVLPTVTHDWDRCIKHHNTKKYQKVIKNRKTIHHN